ncbi:hypothetical protein [Pimelobacter sp. 30-1]|uniref:hypothetical protein n=1 Tax=Pimelobacter sp. 30-1 TaxID=2004991 RepID=UPI001C04B0CC|nr:hypothetical protein [Pimelobacter sp. 30-1]
MANPRPSTQAAALRLVAIFIAGMRIATLVQMAPSLATAITTDSRHAATVATWVVALVALTVPAVLVVLRGRPLGPAAAVADVTIAVLLLLAGLWTVPVDLRQGTWLGFQAGYAICVACSLLTGATSRRLYLPLLAALAAATAIYQAPTVTGWSDVPDLLGNLLTILVLGPLAWTCTRMIIRIGAEADEARRLAADAARTEEERRARTAIHNGTAVLRLLVETGGDADQPAGLRQQAEIELSRMRAYLTGDTLPAAGTTSLAAVVTASRAEFDDLPITVVAHLADEVELDRAVADDLAAALRSLLLNVRLHAGAREVVLHAEEHEDGDGWEVSLHDDGVGFAIDEASYGVGIRDVVVGQLARSGVTTAVDSVPGLGTTITLTRTEEPA